MSWTERIAALLLVLILAISGGLIWFLADTEATMQDQLNTAEAIAANGDWNSARQTVSDAAEEWEHTCHLLRTVIHHDRLCAVSDALSAAGAAAVKEDTQEFKSGLAQAQRTLERLVQLEKPLPENIF